MKYLFISNSSKPSKEEYESKEKIKLNNFSIPNVEAALAMGYEVYMGINRKYAEELECEGYPVKFYDANIFRSIFNIKDNYKAYRNLKLFLKKHKIGVIHCNTPIGGFLGRICGKKAKVPKIIYTVHGFHFFKGNNTIKNFIFKGVEKRLAKITDNIITINEEDFLAANKFKLRNNGRVYKVNGVGINFSHSENYKDNYIHEILEINRDNIVCVSAGDLIKRKNYKVAIKAI